MTTPTTTTTIPGICPFADWRPVSTFQSGLVDRVGYCDHTASGFYETLSDQDFWESAGTSVHFCIARDGRICQLVNIFHTAWGQGTDAEGNPVNPSSPGVTWPPFPYMDGRNPNGYLISTEHEDAMVVDGRTVYVPGSEWTPAQYDADRRVKEWCREECERHGFDLLVFDLDSLASHFMFDPVNRAACAGEFWEKEYRQRLYGDLLSGGIIIRHNALGDFWTGRELDDSEEELMPSLVCRCPVDFELPGGARLIRLDVLVDAGRLQIFDGSGAFAGEVLAGQRVTIDAFPDTQGNLGLGGRDGCRINLLGSLGYWM